MEDEHPLNTDNEESSKENHIKEEEKVEETKKELVEEKPIKTEPVKEEIFKPKKSRLWPVLTGIFALLFVISLFTNGFNFGMESITGATAGESDAIILNDERCTDCDTTTLVENLKAVFPNLNIEEIDYSTKQGEKLYKDNELDFLPAVLFTTDIEKEAGYSQIERFMEPKGEYLLLLIGADFDPEEEICDNNIDDNGNKKIDCKDPYCAEKLVCRKEIPNKLDLFVMSQCPYGTMALDAMEEVLKNLGDIEFEVHYIANENPDGTFNSLHGQPEVDENIRELCAKKYYGVDYKYMDYIWCRNPDIMNPEWKNCAFKSEISHDKIEACSTGDEGKELLSKDIKLAQTLGIGASPTWLANNRYTFSGINAEIVRQNMCNYNSGMAGCDTILDASQTEGGQC